MMTEWDSDDDTVNKSGSKKFKKSKTRACMNFFGGGCGKVFKKDTVEKQYCYEYNKEFRNIKILSTSEACFQGASNNCNLKVTRSLGVIDTTIYRKIKLEKD